MSSHATDLYSVYAKSSSSTTCLSQYQYVSIVDLMELRMKEVVVTSGTVRHAKLQSDRHHEHTFLQAEFPSCCPSNSVRALQEKVSDFMDLLTPSSRGGLLSLSWPLKAPGYLGWGLPSLLSALWCQYPINSSQ